MIAVDAGFLYALLDKSDAWHVRAVAALPTVQEGWITTWPALTDASHLMTRRLGTRFAQALMGEVADGGLGSFARRRETQLFDGLGPTLRKRRPIVVCICSQSQRKRPVS